MAPEEDQTTTPEVALPEVATVRREAEILAWPLPWSGRRNVVTAATIALFDIVAGQG